jgi:hypothetical protein
MFKSASRCSASRAGTIVVTLETTSVTIRKNPPPVGLCIENRNAPCDASLGSPLQRSSRWSYYVFCRELRTLLERGAENAVRVGGSLVLF